MSTPRFRLPASRTLSIAFGFAVSASPAMAAFTFFDGTFKDPDWVLSTITNTNGSTSSSQGFQVASGGNGGSYRSVTHQMEVSGQYALVLSVHMSNGAFWDPSTQGAITSINYSEDSRNSVGAMGTGLAISQGGNVYVLRQPGLLYTFGNWGTNTRNGILAADMYRIDASGNFFSNQNPDFSASGGTMQFGFWRGNGSGTTGAGSFSYDTAIDNWGVEIVIPSPGAFALVGMAGLIVSRRRA